jgi:hypothetical protein
MCARLGRGLRALTQLGDVCLSVLLSLLRPPRLPAAEGCECLSPWSAARNHGDSQIHMESKFIKIHVKPPATYLYS